MIGGWELMVILFVILILFGGKKLPEFARHLGQGIREFKKAANGMGQEPESKTHLEEVQIVETQSTALNKCDSEDR